MRAAGISEIADTGIGIEKKHLDRLTERFYRVDTGRSRRDGGTGLGLAIVKHVLERHDARLEIESRPGEGSRFSVISLLLGWRRRRRHWTRNVPLAEAQSGAD